MEYQQAKYIREMPSLGELIRREAVYGKRGAIGSVTEALKQKFNIKRRLTAKMVGIKEKLDPMNWAKMMFGKTGAALYGRAFNRSDADMQYFAGRARPLGGRSYNIGEVPKYRGYEPEKGSGGKAGKSLLPILGKMYDFLKEKESTDKRHKEMASNFREEQKMEDDRRHKELMDAISGMGGKKSTASPLKAKKEGGGLFDNLKEMIEAAIEAVKKTFQIMIEKALESYQWLLKASQWAKNLLGLTSWAELVSGMIAYGPAMALLTPFMLAALEKEKIRQNPNAPEYKDNPYAMSLRGEAATEGQAAEINTRKSQGRKVLRNEIAQALTGDFSDKELTDLYGADKKTLTEWTRTHTKPSDQWQIPTAAIAGTNYGKTEAGAVKPVDAAAEKAANKSRAEFAKTDPRLVTNVDNSQMNVAPPAVPAPVTPGSTVTNLTNQSNTLKLESKFTKPQENVVNNKAISASKQQQESKPKLPAVRNHEESFQRMIFDSTRVV